MAKIKICGIRTLEEVEIINQVKPDYIGFVFTDDDRKIDYHLAQDLKQLVDENVVVVGIFKDNNVDAIVHLLNKNIIDIAQLHGKETEDDILHIKKVTKKPVIKSVYVETLDDILAYKETVADYLLFDSGKIGNDQPFNWTALDRLKDFKVPFFFSGGLNCENVKNALEYAPFGVDISSSVEVNDKKDYDKIQNFISIVRR